MIQVYSEGAAFRACSCHNAPEVRVTCLTDDIETHAWLTEPNPDSPRSLSGWSSGDSRWVLCRHVDTALPYSLTVYFGNMPWVGPKRMQKKKKKKPSARTLACSPCLTFDDSLSLSLFLSTKAVKRKLVAAAYWRDACISTRSNEQPRRTPYSSSKWCLFFKQGRDDAQHECLCVPSRHDMRDR